jgi:hypothetical protein
LPSGQVEQPRSPVFYTAIHGRNYVFYAAPPALQCMEAYLDFCRLKNTPDTNELPKMGFLLTSSYAPIRIYRVKA